MTEEEINELIDWAKSRLRQFELCTLSSLTPSELSDLTEKLNELEGIITDIEHLVQKREKPP
jgi:hypothetical protein